MFVSALKFMSLYLAQNRAFQATATFGTVVWFHSETPDYPHPLCAGSVHKTVFVHDNKTSFVES